MTSAYADQGLGEFLDRVASREAAPGGGAVAAVSVSLAAGLVAMTARLSTRLVDDSANLADEADAIRRQAARLADEDSEAYRAVLAASRADGGSSGEGVAAALDRAARVPVEVAGLAARAAVLAARLALEGNPRLRGDATTALVLAEAAARSACALVRTNVEEGDGDRSLVDEAELSVQRAAHALHELTAP
jgi:methenyltetrahydrofolate cyclohydrolase